MSNCDLCGETASYHLCDEHAAEGERSLIDLRQQLAAAERQRDELLAALQPLLEYIEASIIPDKRTDAAGFVETWGNMHAKVTYGDLRAIHKTAARARSSGSGGDEVRE